MHSRFRLRSAEDFARLRAQGRAVHHRLMTISLAPNGLAYNRYGFITSKHLGKAVKRNRVRRLLREAMRQLHPRLGTGYDVVVVARSAVVGQPFVTVVRILEQLTCEAGLLVEGDMR